MAEAIIYCEACGHLIPPSDVSAGNAAMAPGGALCTTCVSKMSSEQRAALRNGATGARTGSSRVRKISDRMKSGGTGSSRRVLTPARGSTPVPVTRRIGGKLVAAFGMVAGLLAGIAAVVALASSGAPAGTGGADANPEGFVIVPALPRVTADPPSVPVEEVPAVPELDAAVGAVPVAPAPAPAAVAAPPTTDGNPDARAESALAEAKDMARTLVLMGRYDQARAEYEAVRDEFERTPWFEASGRATIRSLIEDVGKQRAAIVAKAFAAGEAALSAGEFARAKAALSKTTGWTDEEKERARAFVARVDRADSEAAAARFGDGPHILKGLVGWWRFDGEDAAVAVDSSGNGHHGTVVGAATRVEGKAGRAISLDGKAYVDLNAHAKRFARVERGTIAAWFKMTKASSGYCFVSLSTGHLTDVLLVGGKGDKPWVELKHGRTPAYWAHYKGVKYAADQWHHVALVVDADGLRAYLDGRREALSFRKGSRADTRFLSDVRDAKFLELGRSEMWDADGWMHRFVGLLDDVRIYDRPLSDEEVARIATGGAAPASAAPDTSRPPPAPDRAATKRNPDTSQKRPGPSPVHAPAANAVELIRNGGFESAQPGTRFAASWLPQQLGARGGYSVRHTRSNFHDGNRSIELRALDDGPRPGIAAPVSLSKGAYVLKVWASADVGASAAIRVTYGDIELPAQKAGDDWTALTFEVRPADDRRNTLLKIYTTTSRVRVWIDDVSLKRAR